MTPNSAVYATLFIAAILLFCVNSYRRLFLITVGKKEDRFGRPAARVWNMFVYAFGQKRVVSRLFGLNHFVIFWSFMILLLANGEFLVHGLFPSLTLQRLPVSLHHVLTFAFESVSLLALIAVIIAASRRLFFPPPYLSTSYIKARSGEALMILVFIGFLMIAYFGLHAAAIALGQEMGGIHTPVSGLIARSLTNVPAITLEHLAALCRWAHAILLLVFLNFLPLSKHMHIITAIPNCYFRSFEKPNTQPREEFAKGNRYGAGDITQFTWKDLFDTYCCTECGRCQDACPATNTGKPLNPRQIVHDMKMNLLKNAPLLWNSAKENGKEPLQPLIGDQGEGSCSKDALWSCTTCGACIESCPVFIEQMPKIIKMRRHLVQMESKFPEELLNLFENMEQRSNPWGIAPTERTKWCATLPVKTFAKGETEYLLYVGCAGTFDARNKSVTVALATLLNAAGVSWGILGKEEKCCGDSLRRLGNEYVFDKMAKENVKQFYEKGVTKIITQCPHCYNTLKNDYRQYGATLNVVHHSELIHQLLKEGGLKPKRIVEGLGKTVIHDSCYLGRHNDIYEPPRDVIGVATGKRPGELKRNRNNSFCCGAGGGRMWMEERLGERINLARVKETLDKKPDTLCVSCPYCMTMFEDGLKDAGAANVKVRDISEVVVEAFRDS